MVIMHNMAAINAQRQVVTGEKKTEKSTERLSSGYRINRLRKDALANSWIGKGGR